MPRNTLTLSLVIPAYNEENHLKACLDSVAAQTLKPDEVIVVDNNSTDRTVKIARQYKFVTVIKESRQGVVFARDSGFNAAKSDLIGRIDADTVLPHDWVARVKSFFADPQHAEHGLTGGCYFYNIRFPHMCGWWQGQIAFRVNRLLLGHYILFGSNMALPKQMWLQVKDNVCDDIDVHEDLDLAIHLHRLGHPITYHESLKVGVKMRRVFENREELWPNLQWWPNTLKRHGIGTWRLGWIGAAFLYISSFIFGPFQKSK